MMLKMPLNTRHSTNTMSAHIRGILFQASNFLRAFRTLPEAAALGLIMAENEEVAGRYNLGRLIQSWQRFMHQQIHSVRFWILVKLFTELHVYNFGLVQVENINFADLRFNVAEVMVIICENVEDIAG